MPEKRCRCAVFLHKRLKKRRFRGVLIRIKEYNQELKSKNNEQKQRSEAQGASECKGKG